MSALGRALAFAICGLLLLAGLAGCGTTRPTSPPDAIQCGLSQFEVKDLYSDLMIYRARQFSTQSLTDAQPSLNVLALSAGGEFGAYGAGFLAGWRSAGNSATPTRRSDIQIVTGVSTGAILATHAFLATWHDEKLDAAAENIYRGLSGPVIYRSRYTLEYLWANSLFDTTGKDKLIRTYVDSPLIAAVAQAPEGRFLYIGMVDADSGRFMRIDMVKLASTLQGTQRDLCYQAVIGASSAIPIAFSPIFVDGMMLVDGGARHHLFLTSPPPETMKPGITRNLISLVHGDLSAGRVTVDNGVIKIAGRAASLATDEGVKDSIRLVEDLAAKPDPYGKRTFNTYYAAAAAAAKSPACVAALKSPECAGGLSGDDLFCKPFMNCLADAGEKDGLAYASGQKPWLRFQDLNLSTEPLAAPARKFAQ